MAGQSLRFVACSTNVYWNRTGRERARTRWQTIFNGVDMDRYTFTSCVDEDAPLIFLGRIEPCKGVHNAIAIAKEADRRLVIAGNVPAEGQNYFEGRICPLLDGNQIRYIGPVNDTQKNSLLGSAAALLMPIEWDEPFGIVMAEALACGTPVIAFPRGSVNEVIVDGVTGFICRSINEAARAVDRLDRIDRVAARADCEARFSSTVITDAYENLCWELTQQCAGY